MVELVHTPGRPGPQRGPRTRHVAGDALTQATLAVVLAGGRGSRLCQLTETRAKPAMPFAGKLKIIDFALSNCVNSGIRRIAVLTQYKAQSLIRHIEHGWGFLASSLGEYVDVVPAQQRVGEGWYAGTADAVFQNLEMLRRAHTRHVLVLAGDHVYKMDYGVMLAQHVARGADVTVACVEVPLAEAVNFGVMEVGEDARVLAFCEKPAQPRALACPGGSARPDASALVSMGIYVFNTDFLCEQLARDAADTHSTHDFGRDLLPRLVRSHDVRAHCFADSCVGDPAAPPYWRDVGTVDAFWQANIDLTRVVPELNLYDDDWPILSLQAQLPPAKFVFDDEGRRGMALDSLVSGGCIVSGATVRRSILFARVRVGDYSLVEDCVVLPEAVIGRHVRLRRAVVDKRCVLPDGFRAGLYPEEDRAWFHVTERGVTLITPGMLAALDNGRQRRPAPTRPGASP